MAEQDIGADRHIVNGSDKWNPWALGTGGDTLMYVEIKSHDIDGKVKNQWCEWWRQEKSPADASEFITRTNREVIKLKLFDSKREAISAAEYAHGK